MFKISDECCNRDKKQFCICVIVVFPKWAMVFYGGFFGCDWNLPRVLFGNYMILWSKLTISVNCSEINLFFSKTILNNITHWYCKIIVYILVYVQSSERMVVFFLSLINFFFYGFKKKRINTFVFLYFVFLFIFSERTIEKVHCNVNDL